MDNRIVLRNLSDRQNGKDKSEMIIYKASLLPSYAQTYRGYRNQQIYGVYYYYTYDEVQQLLNTLYPSITWPNAYSGYFWFNDPEEEMTFIMGAT